MTSAGTQSIAAAIEAAAAAALAARGVAEADCDRIAKTIAARCEGLPQFQPPVIRAAPATILGRKARERFVEEQAGKFLGEVVAYIDQVIAYCVEQLVEIEIERLPNAAQRE